MGTIEDEMVGWHDRVNGQEFEQTSQMVNDRETWHAAVHGITNSPTQLSNWTTTTPHFIHMCVCVCVSHSVVSNSL